MGKWSNLKGTVDPLPYDDALRQTAARLDGLTPAQLAERYNVYDEQADRLSAELKDTTFQREATKIALITAMEREGLDSASFHGYRYTPTPEPYPIIKDPVAFRAWSLANAPDAMKIAAPTVKAMTKHALEEGQGLPDGVDVFLKTDLRRTKI